MTLQEQINSINCSGNGVKGTGLAGCRIDMKLIKALGLVQKGYIFNQVIDKDYMEELIKDGILIMLQGVVTFEDATADDNIVTRAGTGIKAVAGKNPYEKVATFDNGINFHTALTTLSGYEDYDIVLWDIDNTMWFTQTKSGQPKGFTLGMFENGKYMNANGTDLASQSVVFQMIERYEIDQLISWVTNDSLDFYYTELKGVNETVVTVSPIAPASTTIKASVFLLDKTHPVEGLLPADFLVTKNGVAVVISTAPYNATTKKYALTVPATAAAEVYTVALKDTIKTLAGVFYKSNTDSVVVA